MFYTVHWIVEFYRDAFGKSDVEEYLDSIEDKKLKTKVLRDIGLLQEFGTNLSMPYTKHIKGDIWELRTQQSRNISRILYFTFCGNKIVLLNGFIKKTQKTPSDKIDQAIKYKEDYKRRYE